MKAKIIIFVILLWEAHANLAAYLKCPVQNESRKELLLPHPTDCAKFLNCDLWGTVFVKDCPHGTLWDDTMKTCNHRRNVKCNTKTTIIPTTPARSYQTRPPIETTTAAYNYVYSGNPNAVVSIPNNADFLPYPDETSSSAGGLRDSICPEDFQKSKNGCTSTSTPRTVATTAPITQATSTTSTDEHTEEVEYYTTDANSIDW